MKGKEPGRRRSRDGHVLGGASARERVNCKELISKKGRSQNLESGTELGDPVTGDSQLRKKTERSRCARGFSATANIGEEGKNQGESH